MTPNEFLISIGLAVVLAILVCTLARLISSWIVDKRYRDMKRIIIRVLVEEYPNPVDADRILNERREYPLTYICARDVLHHDLIEEGSINAVMYENQECFILTKKGRERYRVQLQI